MFPLPDVQQNKKKKESPSPKQIKKLLYIINPPCKVRQHHPVKGISHPTFLIGHIDGSMTLEAAIALPLMLFFLLTIGSIMESFTLHTKAECTLRDAGREIALYSACLDQESEGSLGNLFSAVWLQEKIRSNLTDSALEGTLLSRDAVAISVRDLSDEAEPDCIKYEANITISPSIGLSALGKIRYRCVFCAHLWNGYGKTRGEDETSDIVYVTENGIVYHRDLSCSYLKLSIQKVNYEEACEMVNEEGRRYDPCEFCGKGVPPEYVYITEEGRAIHFSRECLGLKRTVKAISLTEVTNYAPCQRCGRLE